MSEILEGFLQDQVAVLKKKIAALEAENERLKEDSYFALYKSAKERVFAVEQERDRQYEFNAGQIAKVAALEAENERLREDDAMITTQIGQLEEERDALKEQVARLSAPVSDGEWDAYTVYSTLSRDGVNGLLAARANRKEQA